MTEYGSYGIYDFQSIPLLFAYAWAEKGSSPGSSNELKARTLLRNLQNPLAYSIPQHFDNLKGFFHIRLFFQTTLKRRPLHQAIEICGGFGA